MVYLIGASCLRNAIDKLPYFQKRNFPVPYTAIGGLSLNVNAVNQFQNLRFLLSNGYLKNKRNIILWHGVISNTVSKHRLNNKSEPDIVSLVDYLKEHKDRFSCIIYCKRTTSLDYFNELRSTGILILDVRRNLISRRKQNNKAIDVELGEVHPHVVLELNLLNTVLNHLRNLRFLTKKKRSKSKVLTRSKQLKEKERKKRQKAKKRLSAK